MKIFAFIMAVMVLALSVMPCADVTAAVNKNAKAVVSELNHQQDCPKSDDCSPFCQCACCTGFPINHTIVRITYLIFFEANPSGSFLPSEPIKIALPIWQPPQLS
ncbi:hypothetical protein FC093_17175 [Ilyomonas limi]|uniref:Uncharacterized protein n=1 Tax=Ilyomonas limi TaxID=2575867 RepID=A0A4U3KYW3_9BACT|nr:DUF6660 family protein [Ilyomonas limi]TKK66317.1 hypothetical protein FC093_17175 [Ilyomonas limi]